MLVGAVLGLALLAIIGPGRARRPLRTAAPVPQPAPPVQAVSARPAVQAPGPPAGGGLAPASELAEGVDTGVPELAPQVLVQMAEELFDAGDVRGAERLYTGLLERSPDHELAQFAIYKLGLLAHARGDLDRAVTELERALHWHGDADPRNPVTQSARHDLERLYAEVRARAGAE